MQRTASRVSGSIRGIFNLPSLLLTGGAGALGGFALNAAGFKESTLKSFEILLGSKDAASKMFAEATQFASVTPFSPKQVIDSYQQLLTAGFKPVEVPVVLKAVGDLAALKGFKPEIIERVNLALGQIKSVGSLQGDELNQLAEAGLPVGKVYEVLAERLNTTTDAVRKLKEQGKISADLGIYAILKALKDNISGGELGNVMKQQSTTLRGLTSTLFGRPFEFFMNVDTTKGFKSVKTFLENLVFATDETNSIGKQFKAIVTGTFGDILETIFGPLAKATNPVAMAQLMLRAKAISRQFTDWWNRTIPVVIDYARAFGSGVADAFAMVSTAWDRTAGVREGISNLLTLLFGFNAAQKMTSRSGAKLFGTLLTLAGIFKLLNFATFGAAGGLLSLGRKALVAGAMMARGWLVAMGPVGWVILAITAAVGATVWAYHRFEWFRDGVNAVWSAIATAAGTAWDFVSTKSKEVWDWLSQIPGNIKSSFEGVWDDFVSSTQTAWGKIEGFFQPAIDKVQSFIDKVTGFKLPPWLGGFKQDPVSVTAPAVNYAFDASGVGQTVSQGFTAGIYKGYGPAAQAAAGMADSAINGTQKALDSHSPSRKFKKLGFTIPQGLHAGILQGKSLAHQAMAALAAATLVSGFAIPDINATRANGLLMAAAPFPATQDTPMLTNGPALEASPFAGGQPRARGVGGGRSITIQKGAVVITINDAQNAEATVRLLEKRLPELLGAALEQAAAEGGYDLG